MVEKLTAYINGQKLNRPEGHTRFDELHMLAYRDDLGKQILLIMNAKRVRGTEWPELDMRTSGQTPIGKLLLDLQKSYLRVLPTDDEGLYVSIDNIELSVQPIAVSIYREKLPSDKTEKLVVALEYPKGTKITEEFESLLLRQRFPLWRPYSEGKATRDDPVDKRILMIEEEANIEEMRRDREDVIKGQELVVGTPAKVEAWISALALD